MTGVEQRCAVPARGVLSPGPALGLAHLRRPAGRLARLVDTAVEQGRLRVAYQPVVELATGAVVGVEALVRIVDPAGGLVAPDAFIPTAEASGAVHELGEWVLRTACRQAATWKRQLPAGAEFGLGVNLSPRQHDDPGLLARLDGALHDSRLEPSALVLELTERLFTAGTDQVRAQLQAVRDRGVHLAADDFGTGYCSVRYLADLPLDIIKIDRSWTASLSCPGRAGRLAAGVFRLAEATGMVTIVEGVETEQERAAARAHGSTLAQGYLFARPMPAAELTALLGVPAG